MLICAHMCKHVSTFILDHFPDIYRSKIQFHLHVRMTPLTFPECSVQCQSLSPCVMPCHAAPVSGAFGGNIVPGCTLLTWDPGVWLSSARPRRTRQKLLAPDQEIESGVCVPELSGSCQAAASQHTPSCRQLSQGENSQQSRRLTGPGREGGLARL